MTAQQLPLTVGGGGGTMGVGVRYAEPISRVVPIATPPNKPSVLFFVALMMAPVCGKKARTGVNCPGAHGHDAES
jgi:hypothetical protein